MKWNIVHSGGLASGVPGTTRRPTRPAFSCQCSSEPYEESPPALQPGPTALDTEGAVSALLGEFDQVASSVGSSVRDSASSQQALRTQAPLEGLTKGDWVQLTSVSDEAMALCGVCTWRAGPAEVNLTDGSWRPTAQPSAGSMSHGSRASRASSMAAAERPPVAQRLKQRLLLSRHLEFNAEVRHDALLRAAAFHHELLHGAHFELLHVGASTSSTRVVDMLLAECWGDTDDIVVGSEGQEAFRIAHQQLQLGKHLLTLQYANADTRLWSRAGLLFCPDDDCKVRDPWVHELGSLWSRCKVPPC
jgi:hypothetical protein